MAVGGAMVGGTMMAVDRRTTGAQVDDQSIELKIGTAVNGKYGTEVHVNATSYNGIVLLTGEVPDAKAKEEVEKMTKDAELHAADEGIRFDATMESISGVKLLQEERAQIRASLEQAKAKEAGHWMLEGKTYVVQDGDVLLFKFNV